MKDYIFKAEWKIACFSIFIFGMIAHGYKMANNLLNHDVLWNLEGFVSAAKFGRPIASWTAGISSFYNNLPWINGLLSILYIAITEIIVIELFDVKKKAHIVLIGALLVTFPSITALFAYIHCTDTYIFGMASAALSVFLYEKGTKKIIKLLGGGILGLTLGVYQSYISLAIILIIFLLVGSIWDGISNKKLLQKIGGYFLFGIIGVLFYGILMKTALIIENRNLTEYMGISSVGQMDLTALIQAVQKQYTSFFSFFFLEMKQLSLWAILNEILLACLIIKLVELIIYKKIYKKIFQCLFIIFSIILVPAFCYPLYFLSTGVVYHRLMEVPVVLIYIAIILIDEYEEKYNITKNRFKRGKDILSFLTLSFIIYINILAANISYMSMEQSNQYTLGLLNRIVAQIEHTENFSEDIDKIIIEGTVHSKNVPYLDNTYPQITGVTTGNFLFEEYHYVTMFRQYFGYEFTPISLEEKERIIDSEDYLDMESWPSSKAIKVIKNVLVIKLDE